MPCLILSVAVLCRPGRLSKVSRRLQQPPCLLASYCGSTRPPHPRRRSDSAKMGAGGRSPSRRWCTVAGSLGGSASPPCPHLQPSWGTGMSQWRWSSTGDRLRRGTGRARSEPGGGCLLGTEEADRCTFLSASWPWLWPS